MIAATVVIENLQQMRTIRSQNQPHEPEQFDENNVSALQARILPTKLEQVKPLTSLKTAQEQWQVWNQAIEAANGKVPSGRIVNEIVAQLKKKPLVLAQHDWQVGDVFTLVDLEGKERKYNGCSCIAKELTDSTVTVEVHDATLSVKLENLNEIDSSDDKRQLPHTLRRVRRLQEVESLDRGAANVLKDISKRTNLTPVEEGLLSWIEITTGLLNRKANCRSSSLPQV
ncbi:hypothetical protein B7486_51930 [cyanobacterium TDX16]|nr:hypothetical protein B7486_51930 [cyanobacterium TDX16]